MALQFVLGSAGSGKSGYVFRKTVKEAQKNLKKNYYVVVPEQFTMQTQRELVRLQEKNSIMNIDVVSFQRLAYRIFDELGKTNMAVLEETGKNLVLRKVAEERMDDLHVMQGNMKKMGYISEVKSLISELTQYNIDPDTLETFIEEQNMSPAFSYKLQDILTMYRGFRSAISGMYITAEEVLEAFCDMAEESKLLKDAVLVLDGFTGFTPIQNNVLYRLMEIVSDIYVTVTIDPAEDIYSYHDMQELFAMSKKTIASLMKMAEETHFEVAEPVVLKNPQADRFREAPVLRFLEQNLFRTRHHRYEKKDEKELKEGIEILSLPNPRRELQYAAEEIARLVHTGEYRYRDFAIISGAIEEYGSYVPQIMEEFGIPFFLDTTKNILLHPFLEFVRSLLQVIEDNFSEEAMFRYLRCGLSQISEDEIDLLENYVLAAGIRGKKKWEARFIYTTHEVAEEDLEALNELRIRVMEPFSELTAVFRKKGATVRECTTALYQFIVSLQIEQQLKYRENQYKEATDLAKAKEYAQIYRIVMDILDKMATLLGDEVMDVSEYAKVLEAGFEAAKVGVIPGGYDCVMIGDIERTRLDDIKVLFIVGVNDGIVPKSDNRGGIISQLEREELAKNHMELAPTARERVFIQRFYLYLAVTKPSQKLYLTYARVGSDGSAKRPSYFIHMIEGLFPGLKAELITGEQIDETLVTPESSMAFLLEGLYQEDAEWNEEKEALWQALLHWYEKEPAYQEQVKAILEAAELKYHAEPISRAVAKALYGNELKNSVTRLEQYAACACAHFLTYGLRLQERELFEFRMADMGNIYHQALENYSRYLKESAYSWFDITEEAQKQLMERAMEEAIAASGNAAMADTAANRYQVAKMKKIFERTIWALTSQIRQGKFEPAQFEVGFSYTDNLNAVNFKLSEEEHMRLQGRIDRIDTYEDKDKLYVKIIDYKSGNTGFELLSLYHGLKLQLVVYMNAAMELFAKRNPAKEVVPAGMFYYHIDDPMVEGTGSESEEEIRRKILENLRLDGVVNTEDDIFRAMDVELSGKSNVLPISVNKDGTVRKSDKAVDKEEFKLIADYTNYRIAEAGNAILKGNTEVNPYLLKNRSSCDYCPYAAVCGFDKKIPGYEVRRLEELSSEEIYERMKEVF
ncbi:MAG: helicase-exonuclease AddAB subunit AddB [Lachnospiraceae bacterium]|nr:helicase-exonuclease AddAB subunit AddB [Lachnospiraceae bacterium]